MRSGPQSRWKFGQEHTNTQKWRSSGGHFGSHLLWFYFHKSEVSGMCLMVPPVPCHVFILGPFGNKPYMLDCLVFYVPSVYWISLWLIQVWSPKWRNPLRSCFCVIRKFSMKLNQGSCVFSVQNGIVGGGCKEMMGLVSREIVCSFTGVHGRKKRWCPNQQ